MKKLKNKMMIRKKLTNFFRHSITVFLILLCFISVGKENSEEKHIYKITTNEIAKEPISTLLYGNFIELGYGIQVETMWSEMFFNRSFEPFETYRVINKLWYDLYYDEKDLSKGYETDWSKFDWYHSGYEHNAWFAAPGDPGKPFIIEDSSSFIIQQTSECNIILQEINGGSGHGVQCLKVINKEQDGMGALAQEGKWMCKGDDYEFRGMIESVDGPINAEIRMYPQGKWDKPFVTIPFEIKGEGFEEIRLKIPNSSYDGYATFSLWIPAQTSIVVDDFSMKPSDSYYGWRQDVVDVFKELNPSIVRFPGGCFASFYNWRDGIGPCPNRKPSHSYFWGGQNYNDVGTAEYAMLCKAAGAEMQMCVNVYHPSKRKFEVDFPEWQSSIDGNFPEFMSLSQGAKSAADWVAYCNLEVGEHPMADLRAEHGYPEPFGVKYWELDNEVLRWFEAEDYAWAAVVYSKAMKAIDPNIKIGLSAYGERSGYDYHEKLEDMLAIAGPYIDFLADRGDAETISDMMLNKVRKYNDTNGTNIKYCDTEWLAYNTDVKRDAYNMAEREGGSSKSFAFSKWYYALNLLKNFMSFQRLGDDMLFVNFNNLANTHSQCAMDTPKEGAYLTASGKALQFLAKSKAAWVVEIENYQPKMVEDFQVQAAWDRKREKMVLYVCNRTAENRTASFDISNLGVVFKKANTTRLIGENKLVMNTLKNPNAIQEVVENHRLQTKNGLVEVKSPAWSFTEVVLD